MERGLGVLDNTACTVDCDYKQIDVYIRLCSMLSGSMFFLETLANRKRLKVFTH